MAKTNKKKSKVTNHIVEQDLSSITQPSVWSAIKKAAVGVCALSISYVMDKFTEAPDEGNRSIPSDIARNAGFAFIVDGVMEIVSVGVLQVTTKFSVDSPTTNINNKIISEKSKRKQNKTSLEIVQFQNSDEELLSEPDKKKLVQYIAQLRYRSILGASYNLLSNCYSAIRYVIDIRIMHSRNISIFSTSWPDYISPSNAGSILYYINVPLINPLFLSLMTLGCAYNTYELLSSLKSPYPRRSNSPFFGFINSISALGSTNLIIRYIPGIQAANDTSRSLEEYQSYAVVWLGYAINTAPLYHVYKNSFQIIFNAKDLLIQRTNQVKIEEVIEEPNLFRAKRQFSHNENPYEALPTISSATATGATTLEATNQNLLYQYTKSKSELENENASSKPTKIKTKGPGNINQVENVSLDEKTLAESDHILYRINDREDQLSKIRELRSFNQVKKRIINSYFDTIAKELPAGAITAIDGSEFELTWSFENRKFQLKYEVPHGTDGSEYKGRKLAKAINVLEVAYLWGWGRQNREDYLNQNCCNSNLERLFYIFAERPKF